MIPIQRSQLLHAEIQKFILDNSCLHKDATPLQSSQLVTQATNSCMCTDVAYPLLYSVMVLHAFLHEFCVWYTYIYWQIISLWNGAAMSSQQNSPKKHKHDCKHSKPRYSLNWQRCMRYWTKIVSGFANEKWTVSWQDSIPYGIQNSCQHPQILAPHTNTSVYIVDLDSIGLDMQDKRAGHTLSHQMVYKYNNQTYCAVLELEIFTVIDDFTAALEPAEFSDEE